jgi:hypothetical protein
MDNQRAPTPPLQLRYHRDGLVYGRELNCTCNSVDYRELVLDLSADVPLRLQWLLGRHRYRQQSLQVKRDFPLEYLHRNQHQEHDILVDTCSGIVLVALGVTS